MIAQQSVLNCYFVFVRHYVTVRHSVVAHHSLVMSAILCFPAIPPFFVFPPFCGCLPFFLYPSFYDCPSFCLCPQFCVRLSSCGCLPFCIYRHSLFTAILYLPLFCGCLPFCIYRHSVFTAILWLPTILYLPPFCIYRHSVFTSILYLPPFCIYRHSVFVRNIIFVLHSVELPGIFSDIYMLYHLYPGIFIVPPCVIYWNKAPTLTPIGPWSKSLRSDLNKSGSKKSNILKLFSEPRRGLENQKQTFKFFSEIEIWN